MKKILKVSVAVTLIGSLAFASTSTKKENKVIKEQGIKFNLVSKKSKIFKEASSLGVFKKFKTNVKKVFKVSNGLYYVKVERNGKMYDFYWDKEKKALFNVPVFLTDDGKVITSPILVNKEILKKAIAFTFGKGQKEIYLFTDPQCPYCKAAEKRLGSKLESNYKTHVILFPLSFHNRALPLVQWILRAKTDKERYERMKKAMLNNKDPQIGKDLGFKHWNDKNYTQEIEEYRLILSGSNKNYKPYFKSEKELKDFQKYLKNVRKIVSQANVRGTPTFLNKNFKQINPYAL